MKYINYEFKSVLNETEPTGDDTISKEYMYKLGVKL